MPDWEKFPKAPITEALLDIRTTLPPRIDLQRLAGFHDPIKTAYPGRQQRTSWQASVQVKEGGTAFASREAPDGFLFTSPDGRQIVQARLDGFTFNRLRPYDTWEVFRGEARRLWARYVEVAEPAAVSRIALRYINRIEIPFPVKDFKEYLLTCPDIGPDLPQGLADFFVRLVVPDTRSACVAIITEAMQPPQDTTVALFLDIDVFLESPFDPGTEDLWGALDHLRAFKNQIFFGSLTSKAKELFR